MPSCTRTRRGRWWWSTTCAALIVAPWARPARAELVTILGAPIGLPIAGGGHHGGRAHGGFFFGVDGGSAYALAAPDEPSHQAFSFGARLGVQFADGLAIQLRYDDLGVRRLTDDRLQVGTFGLRYTLPFLVPSPFVEALGGLVVGDPPVRWAGGAGAGLSLPIGRHLLIDAGVRDFVARFEGTLRQTLAFQLGVTLTFGSAGR